MPILDDLWYGNIESHLEEIERTEDERQLLKEAADNLDALMEVLSDDQNEMLTRYITASKDTEKLHSSIVYTANQKKNYLAAQILENAIDNGYDKIVVIKTRDRGFRKQNKDNVLSDVMYIGYPNFIDKLTNKASNYNRQCDEIDELEKDGRLFVIAPSRPVKVSRLEKDMEKLGDLYWLGYNDCVNNLINLQSYLNS